MRRRMKSFTIALSSLLCSVPLCTSASVASGSLLATIGACKDTNFQGLRYGQITISTGPGQQTERLGTDINRARHLGSPPDLIVAAEMRWSAQDPRIAEVDHGIELHMSSSLQCLPEKRGQRPLRTGQHDP